MADPIDTTAREAPTPVDDGGWDTIDPPAPSTALAPAVPPVTGELDVVPPHRELQGMAAMAATFAGSALVPKALQDKPADVMLVLMTARDLGLSATVALRECHPIDGKVTVSPKLKLAIVRQRGLGRVWPDPANDSTRATWYAVRADDPETTYSSTYTIDDARAAGLDRKDNWRKYPARMVSWRALGYLLDDAFSEVGTGLYSPDEMGAMTDEDGAPIDVLEVEPMVPSSRQRQNAGRAAADTVADGADLWELQARLHALPDEQQRKWRWQKSQHDRLSGVPTTALTAAGLRAARSIVAGLESDARKAGPYDADAVVAEVRAHAASVLCSALCWAPQDAPGPPGGSDTPPEAPAGDEAATGDPIAEFLARPTPRPAAAEQPAGMSELIATHEATVKAMTVEQVRTDLADYELSTDGGAKACRDRLVRHLIETDINEGTPT